MLAKDLGKRRGGPVDPVGLVPGDSVEHVVGLEEARVHVALVEEEAVEERVQLRREARRPRTVRMPADLLKPMQVRDTERLPHRVRSGHAPERAERAQPDVVRVLERDHRARRDERREEVVVEREHAQVVHEVGEVGREPDVLRHDLRRRLHDAARVLLELGQPPARVPARAGLLRDRERDARLERARHERALAVARAARHGDLARVDVCGRGLLERVDDPAHTPCPGGHRARRRVPAVEIEEEPDTATGRGVVLLRHVRVGVDHVRNL